MVMSVSQGVSNIQQFAEVVQGELADVGLKVTLKPTPDIVRDFYAAERARGDAIGRRDAELLEEHARQLVVVVLPGVDQQLLVVAPQRPRHGGRLHELRAVSYDGYDAHGKEGWKERLIIAAGVFKTVAGGARAAAGVTAGAARHAAWYLRHQLYGSARSNSDSAERKPPGPR